MKIESGFGQKKDQSDLKDTILKWYDEKLSDEEREKLREKMAKEIVGEDPSTLQTLLRSLELVEKLREVSLDNQKTFDPRVQAVFVLSGPGMFLHRSKFAKQYESSTYRWLNRDRLLTAVIYARRIAAARKNEAERTNFKPHDLTLEDIEKYGPVIYYNGTTETNQELEEVLEKWTKQGWDASFAEANPIVKTFPYPQKSPYPKSKVLVVTEPNLNTKTEIENLKKETGPGGKIQGLQNIAVVATILDFVRVGNYIQKEFSTGNQGNLKFWAYPARARRGFSKDESQEEDVVPEYLLSELERLAHYFQQGHLADRPYQFQNVSSSL